MLFEEYLENGAKYKKVYKSPLILLPKRTNILILSFFNILIQYLEYYFIDTSLPTHFVPHLLCCGGKLFSYQLTEKKNG